MFSCKTFNLLNNVLYLSVWIFSNLFFSRNNFYENFVFAKYAIWYFFVYPCDSWVYLNLNSSIILIFQKIRKHCSLLTRNCTENSKRHILLFLLCKIFSTITNACVNMSFGSKLFKKMSRKTTFFNKKKIE